MVQMHQEKQSYQGYSRLCGNDILISQLQREYDICLYSVQIRGHWQAKYIFIRFLLEGIEYEYSFELNKVEILKEALYYYPNGRRSLVFSRDETKGPDKRISMNSVR